MKREQTRKLHIKACSLLNCLTVYFYAKFEWNIGNICFGSKFSHLWFYASTHIQKHPHTHTDITLCVVMKLNQIIIVLLAQKLTSHIVLESIKGEELQRHRV